MKIPSQRTRTRFYTGFSLPEVTLAVAITALGLTSVLGLVPTSLDTLRQAGNLAAETRITQQVLASVNAAEWTDAAGTDLLGDTFQGRRYYFDDEAVELDATQADEQVTYVAEVELASSDVALSTGAVSNANPADPFLRRVKVKIANVALKDFDFKQAKPMMYRAYSSLVTRAGK